MSGLPIYLDYNATTPLLPEVRNAMLPILTHQFGNPSSSHVYGMQTRQLVQEARMSVAALIGCDTSDVIFTSGGTEANNQALKGIALHPDVRRRQIITSAIEHPAILSVCDWLETQGFDITILPVDEYGMVHPSVLEEAISDQTLLVSVMHSNNEIGTIQPIRQLAAIAHRHGALMHTDAAQSLGKVAVDVEHLGVDLLTVVSHKLYGPKGIGALFVRPHVKMVPLLHGAGHERGRRPGTENVLQIVGLGAACAVAKERLAAHQAHLGSLRDALFQGLIDQLGTHRLKRNGHPEASLPNTLSISFKHLQANVLLSQMGDHVAASAGAACHSDQIEVSGVLKAIRLPIEWAMGTIRFSVGVQTTYAEIKVAISAVADAVRRLQ